MGKRLLYPAFLAAAILVGYWGVLHLTLHSEDFGLIAGGASWGFGGTGFFRPIVILVLHGLHRVVGWNPSAFHGLLLAVHVVNSWLLYLLLRRWLRSANAAFSGALLLALHPLVSEAVIWVSALTSSLALLWILASVLCWDRALASGPGPRGWWFTTALAFQVLALGSKEVGVITVFLLAAVSAARGALPGRATRPLAASLALTGAHVAFYVSTRLPDSGQSVSLGYHTLRNLRHFLLSAVSLGPLQDRALVRADRWLGLPAPGPEGGGHPGPLLPVLLALLGLVLLGALAWRLRTRWTAVGLVWILAGGLFLWVRPFHVLEWSYPYPSRVYLLPLAGFAIFVASVLDRATDVGGPLGHLASLALVILVFVIGVGNIHHRMEDWEKASFLVRRTLTAFQRVVPAGLPPGTNRIVLVNPPDSYREAFVFRNGLPEAIAACCPPHVPVTVVRESGPPHRPPGQLEDLVLWWYPQAGTWIRIPAVDHTHHGRGSRRGP